MKDEIRKAFNKLIEISGYNPTELKSIEFFFQAGEGEIIGRFENGDTWHIRRTEL